MSLLTTIIKAITTLLFLFAGSNKLYPVVPEMHAQLIEASKYFEILMKREWSAFYQFPDAILMKQMIGVAEVSLAIAVWFTPLAHLAASAIMGGAFYFHYATGLPVGDDGPLMTVAVVGTLNFLAWLFSFGGSNTKQKQT